MATNTNNVAVRLRKLATEWAKQITREANTNLGGKVALIKVSSSSQNSNFEAGEVSIVTTAEDIAVDQNGQTKRVAHAYEYGSGIHGRKHSKYKIAPRFKKVLAFYWDKFDVTAENPAINSPKFVGVADDGRLLFRYVDHPGVQAVKNGRGYMKPAIDKVRRQINKEIRPALSDEFKLSIKRAFQSNKSG